MSQPIITMTRAFGSMKLKDEPPSQSEFSKVPQRMIYKLCSKHYIILSNLLSNYILSKKSSVEQNCQAPFQSNYLSVDLAHSFQLQKCSSPTCNYCVANKPTLPHDTLSSCHGSHCHCQIKLRNIICQSFNSVYEVSSLLRINHPLVTAWRLLQQINRTESFSMLLGSMVQYSVKSALNLAAFLQGTN